MSQVLAFIFEQIANILTATSDYFDADMFQQVADFFAGVSF